MKANFLSNFFPHSFLRISRSWKLLTLLAVALGCVCVIGGTRLYASCIALDDVPLDVQQQQAPGIVMFLIDDSGSMDWEVMCPEAEGKFLSTSNPDYEYIFANPGDNSYSSGDGNGTIIEGSAAANRWRSQWAGYNKLYYDPTAVYTPWPTFTAANLNTPRSDPAISGNTLNLSAVYHDFGEPLI